MKQRILALLLVLALLGTYGASVRAQDDSGASWCVSAWYPSSDHPGGYDALLAHTDVLDEVNPFWYTADADGSLRLLSGAEDAGKLAAWAEAGLLVVPTLSNFAAPTAINAGTRAAHIAAIVDTVERMDYAGIDLDYEGFPRDTRAEFSLFVEALAIELHARERLLSVTVHAKTEDLPPSDGAAAQDWARLIPAADIFRIMTYDYTNRNSREPGPIGPPQWAHAVLAYAATLTDLGNVRLGVHFYGYRWQRSDVTTVTWESVQRSIESFGLEIERNPADGEAWVYLKTTGLPAQTTYFADAQGIAHKLDLLLADYPDLGGVAIWGIGGEDPANWDILREIHPAACDTGMIQ